PAHLPAARGGAARPADWRGEPRSSAPLPLGFQVLEERLTFLDSEQISGIFSQEPLRAPQLHQPAAADDEDAIGNAVKPAKSRRQGKPAAGVDGNRLDG